MRARLVIRFLVAQAVVGALTAIAFLVGANATTAGFAYLIAILVIAISTNLATALITSIAAVLQYNYFFFPPLRTFTIQEPANWVALASFFIASLVATRLVMRARQQAETAEARRREIEALAVERERFLAEAAHIQALEEGDALKTSLLRAVSHDLATPLTAVSMQIDRLRAIVSGPAAMVVEDLAEHTGRLRRRIENLLAMARLEARSVVPRPEPTPAADLFRSVREHLPLVAHARILDTRVTADCPEVYVDPSLALEILANLVENAHQASPSGAAIELTASSHPLDQERVRLQVADRGPGLRDAEIVAPASDTLRRGLGLEIARSLAVASGGEVTLANRADGGAIAYVDLPAAHLPVVDDEVAV